MRFAVISDVHGNLEALEAVLKKLNEESFDALLFLGDSVGYGPDPNECIEVLRKKAQVLLAGNHDRAVIGLADIAFFNPHARSAIEWTQGVLKDENRKLLESLPVAKRMKDDNLYLVHSTPKEPEEWHYLINAWDAYKNFHFFSEKICLIGHSHVPAILEEPPEDSLIILVTSRPDRLPATIRSRCSKISFHTHSLTSCREILKGRMTDDEAEQAARLSQRRPGLALSSDVKEDRDWFIDLLKAMTRAEKDSWASREEMEKWFDLALIFIRDITVYRITGKTSLLINADLAETLGKTGKSVDVKGIIEIYKELSFLKTMLLFNLNKSLTWNYTASLMRKELYS